MGLIRQFLHQVTLGIIPSDEDIARAEEARMREYHRQHTPVMFTEKLTEEDFCEIVNQVAQPFKRLSVSINEQFVTGTVRTVSGIDTWSFKLDFNDFGSITGNYWWVHCQNNDSKIPDNFADELSAAIRAHLS